MLDDKVESDSERQNRRLTVRRQYGWPANEELLWKRKHFATILWHHVRCPRRPWRWIQRTRLWPSWRRLGGQVWQDMMDLTRRNRECCSDDPTGKYSETNLGTDHVIHKWQEQIIKDSQNTTQQVANTRGGAGHAQRWRSSKSWTQSRWRRSKSSRRRCKERKLIQTTINLAKINQTCLFEILEIQCSAEVTQQVSNTQQPAEDCISQDEIKQRTVEQVESMHDQHDQYDVHAVKKEQSKIIKNTVQSTNPIILDKIDQVRCKAKFATLKAVQKQRKSNTSGHLPCRYVTIGANDAKGTESGKHCEDSLRCSTSTRSSKIPVTVHKPTQKMLKNDRNARIPCLSQQIQSTARRPTR